MPSPRSRATRSGFSVHSLSLAIASALPALGAFAAVPAFPGADGAGGSITGGRGGIIYHVTKLDTKAGDSGVGTLQYGINDTNFAAGDGSITRRTIVFDVGGTIWLGRLVTDVSGWDTTSTISVGSNVTIAGQTAPGGITIAGGQIKINGDRRAPVPVSPLANVIVRNITIASTYGARQTNSTSGYHDGYTLDAMDINSNQVMIDHVSAVFATDETISANEGANNTTIQYTTMAQGQSYPQADAQGGGAFKAHALGNLWGIGSNALTTFSHNLYAHISGRAPTPQVVTSVLTKDANGNYIPGYTDFRNNVVYNWFSAAGYGSAGEPGSINFYNNYYKVGAGGDGASNNATDFGIKAIAGGTTVFSGSSSTNVFQNGGNLRNNLDGTTTTLTNSNFGSAVFGAANPAAATYKGTTDTAAAALTQVLKYTGANWQNRSAIDTRLVNQTTNRTGKVTALDDALNGYNAAGTYVTNSSDTEWNKLLALRSTTNGGTGGTGAFARAANYDTDADGMPNTWETAMGLNLNVADNNANITNDGYTNVEDYLNEAAAWPASAPLTFSNGNATGRYAEIGNWTTGVFKPSRYDEAQLNSGTVTIDVPGQHAGTLKVATASGNTATLAVTGGWIDVSQSLLVGPAGTATVNQTAGTVRADTSIVIGGTLAGSYNLSGGTLSTPLLTKGAGGANFNFTGGTLHADAVGFDLTNNGGTLAPGSDAQLQNIAAAAFPDINNVTPSVQTTIGTTAITGKLTLNSGTLQIELASLASFDKVTATSSITLGGSLDVQPFSAFQPHFGDQFVIGAGSTATGSFASITRGYSTLISGGNVFLKSELAEWKTNGNGNSSLSSNWIGGVPGINGGGTDAGFLSAITADHTVTVDGAYTLATITFSNSHNYNLADDGVTGHGITLSTPLGGLVSVTQGVAHSIDAPVTFATSSTINTAAGTGLSLGGPLTVAAGKTITKTGGGTLSLGSSSITAGTGSALVVTGGAVSIDANPSANMAVSVDGATTSLNFAASPAGIFPRSVSALSITGNAHVSLLGGVASSDHSTRSVLVTGGLTLSGSTNAWTAALDLGGNDLVVHGGNLSAVTNQIRQAFAAGNWTGNGIRSSAAAGDTTHRTVLGVIPNDNGSGGSIYSTAAGNPFGSFDGQDTTAGDVLVKYTYFGDADLNGQIDGTDYSEIDNGFNTHLTGWINGDFNYDGLVDASDYSLIDNVYNTQSISLSASSTTLFASAASEASTPATAVPEPGVFSLIAITVAAFGRRSRRRTNVDATGE